MSNYSITKEQFTETAQAFDVCGLLNDCDKCEVYDHCRERWNRISAETVNFNYLERDDRFNFHGEQIPEPIYSTELLSTMLKRKGIRV